MALTITNRLIRSTDTKHTAEPSGDAWTVSWLPGRILTHSQAVCAMQIAAKSAQGAGLSDDPIWPHINGWACELGLTGPAAVARASEAELETGL